MVGALQISIIIILVVVIINITHFYNRFERTTAFQKISTSEDRSLMFLLTIRAQLFLRGCAYFFLFIAKAVSTFSGCGKCARPTD